MGQWKIRLHNSSISFTGMIPLRKISVGLDRRIGSTEISIFQLVLSITFSVNYDFHKEGKRGSQRPTDAFLSGNPSFCLLEIIFLWLLVVGNDHDRDVSS